MVTETRKAGEFLISEGNGNISREEVTVVSGQDLVAGELVGKVTASGKYATYDNGAADGTETAAGIIYADCDATGGDTLAAIVVRDAEVSSNTLTGSDANGVTDLAALNIIIRS